MGVSCDSFDPQVNALIGRQQGTKDHLKALMKVRAWCSKYKVRNAFLFYRRHRTIKYA
jgi:hypothetical protein